MDEELLGRGGEQGIGLDVRSVLHVLRQAEQGVASGLKRDPLGGTGYLKTSPEEGKKTSKE